MALEIRPDQTPVYAPEPFEDGSIAGDVDEKGRPLIANMTDSEKLSEILAIGRSTQDLVEKFFNDFSSGKMGGMMGMLGKFM